MRSAFNIDEFMSQTIDPEGFVFDTKVAFVEEGEYEADLSSLNPGVYTIKNGPREGQEQKYIRPQWTIADPGVRERMGIDDPIAEQFITIECYAGTWSPVMDKNKNVDLSRNLLTPLGFNTGKKWAWPQLLHSRAWVRVALPNDEERSRYSRVVMVGAKKSDVVRAG